MNERDKELAKQAWTENDWDGHVDIPKLIQLVRADAMEAATRAANESWTLACKKMVEFEREACAKMAEDLNEIGHSYGLEDHIRARAAS
jgi:hypothetical protein